jgi:hypothetical protein
MMTVNLKIEIIKIFTLEFSLSSDKELKLKKDKPDEKAVDTQPAPSKPAGTSK